MIFIHAITKDVPLNNIDVIKGRPIDKIKRKDDNPHVDYLDIKTIKKSAAPLPLTSKLIWLSYSHTGDCHDNMNGKMLMKWITTKFITLSARDYPSVHMLPVTENARYHHVAVSHPSRASPIRALLTS